MTFSLNILAKLVEKNKEATRPNLADKDLGIKTPYWFWGSDRYHKLISKTPVESDDTPAKKIIAPKKDEVESTNTDKIPDTSEVDNDINQILAQNPNMSGATFLNLLKSKGYKMGLPAGMYQDKTIPTPSKEADDAGTFPQALRPVNKKESVNIKTIGFKARFIESSAKDNGIGYTKFKAILLEEGMGNMSDAMYYSREALVSAVAVFEGKKIFADHPTDTEEEVRPERSVKDVLGHFEKVAVEDGEDGQTLLTANVVILPDKSYEWARGLMRHAVEYSKTYPDKSFIGLSINASGDAEEISIDDLMERGIPESAIQKLLKAKENGIESLRIVSTITDAVSCDLVTEAGAGGKVLEMIENERNKKMATKSKLEIEKDAKAKEAAKKLTLKKAAAALIESEDTGDTEESDVPKTVPPKKDGDVEDTEEAGDHEDEDEDIALIKKMMKDYVGGDAEPTDEECEMGKEAYGAAKEMGMEGEEALKCAGYSMKMGKHMAAKQAKTESEAAAAEAAATESEESKKTERKKESSSITLKGEIAGLKERIFNFEKEKEIDKLLQETKIKREYTKEIRKELLESKSIGEVKNKLGMWMKGFKSKGGETELTESLFIQPEKQTQTTKGSASLSDCLID